MNSPLKVQARPENVGGIETRALVSERGQVVARGQVNYLLTEQICEIMKDFASH
jgi:hypothetical protein